MGYTDGQKAANIRYKKECTKQIGVRFFTNNDDEQRLFDYAKSQDNVAGYIKRLIREDMERSQAC